MIIGTFGNPTTTSVDQALLGKRYRTTSPGENLHQQLGVTQLAREPTWSRGSATSALRWRVRRLTPAFCRIRQWEMEAFQQNTNKSPTQGSGKSHLDWNPNNILGGERMETSQIGDAAHGQPDPAELQIEKRIDAFATRQQVAVTNASLGPDGISPQALQAQCYAEAIPDIEELANFTAHQALGRLMPSRSSGIHCDCNRLSCSGQQPHAAEVSTGRSTANSASVTDLSVRARHANSNSELTDASPPLGSERHDQNVPRLARAESRLALIGADDKHIAPATLLPIELAPDGPYYIQRPFAEKSSKSVFAVPLGQEIENENNDVFKLSKQDSAANSSQALQQRRAPKECR